MSYSDYIRERIAHTQKLKYLEGNPLSFTKSKEKPFKAFTLYGNAEGVENSEIVVCGKNLFNINNVYKTGNFNYTIEDNKLTLMKTDNKSSNIYFDLGVSCKTYSNQTLTLSITNETNTSAGTAYLYYYKDETPTMLSTFGTISANTTKTYSVTVPQNDFEQNVLVRIYISPQGTYKLSNIQLEVGKTPTEYEPYKTLQKVALPYTFAENDYLTLLNKKVKTFINGVQTDITDSEVGQAILNLECFEPTTTILCNSETQPNNMYIKYISK